MTKQIASRFTAEQIFRYVFFFGFEAVHSAAVAGNKNSTTLGALIDEPAALGVTDWVH